MSGLLGRFDGAMEGLTAADVEAAGADDVSAEPGADDATPVDAERSEGAAGTAPAEAARRAVDPRAQAVADRLLGRHATLTHAVSEPAAARLVAAHGAASVECTAAAPVVIGRAGGDLLVPLGVVSRQHCAVARDGNRYTVVDLGSANGTLVCQPGGGFVPVGTEPVELQPGDVIATVRGRRPIARLEAPRSAV